MHIYSFQSCKWNCTQHTVSNLLSYHRHLLTRVQKLLARSVYSPLMSKVLACSLSLLTPRGVCEETEAAGAALFWGWPSEMGWG